MSSSLTVHSIAYAATSCKSFRRFFYATILANDDYRHHRLVGGDGAPGGGIMKPIMIIAAAIIVYLAMQSTGNATETATSNPGCVAQYQAEYSAKWGEMTPLQRAWVGANAAACP